MGKQLLEADRKTAQAFSKHAEKVPYDSESALLFWKYQKTIADRKRTAIEMNHTEDENTVRTFPEVGFGFEQGTNN